MKHIHSEAFCLMHYKCENGDCGVVEKIWNSRDGVTPFLITCRCCGETMSHVWWDKDQYMPEYIPEVNQRIFYSLKNIHEVIQIYLNMKISGSYLEEIKKYIDVEDDLHCREIKIKGAIEDENRFEHPQIATITEKNIEAILGKEIASKFYKKEINDKKLKEFQQKVDDLKRESDDFKEKSTHSREKISS